MAVVKEDMEMGGEKKRRQMINVAQREQLEEGKKKFIHTPHHLYLVFYSRTSAPAGLPTSLSQRARYATYFDVAVLRCLLQPHWTEEGVHWALIYYLQRLKQILEERPERTSEPLVLPLPRPRSSSMVAATPSLVNTHKTQVMMCCQITKQCHFSSNVRN